MEGKSLPHAPKRVVVHVFVVAGVVRLVSPMPLELAARIAGRLLQRPVVVASGVVALAAVRACVEQRVVCRLL